MSNKIKFRCSIIDPDGLLLYTKDLVSGSDIEKELVLPFLRSIEPDVDVNTEMLQKAGYVVSYVAFTKRQFPYLSE